jgi:heat shock protein beta
MSKLFLFAFIVLICSPALVWYCHAEETADRANAVDVDLKQEKVGLKTDDNVADREANSLSHQDEFTLAERTSLNQENFQFQAEIDRLLHLIINSLYSNKDIFLREVISNASDALDKIRYLSLTDKNVLGTGEQTKLEIRIKAEPEKGLLHIRDTGIGMTKQDLINNLGRIAKSGTKEFLEKFKQGSDLSQIGQFGVGFYSTFLVADTVIVTTKNNNDKQYVWTSSVEAGSSFDVSEDPRGDTLGRGTMLTLVLKESAREYLEQSKLEELVKKYSEFINFPIYLWTTKEVEREVPLEETAEEAAEETEDLEVTETEEGEEEEAAPKTQIIKENVSGWAQMNSLKPLWTRKPKEISDEEYNNFYKSLTGDSNEPLAHSHFVAEGDVEFTGLLYVPAEANHTRFEKSTTDLKLYVKRVFINDQVQGLLPRFLAFLKGLVDSDDLPLNVSREMLQQSKLLNMIKKKLVRKAIAMFQALEDDKEKYEKFYKNYGTNLKLGVIEDTSNRERLAKLLRFYTYKHQSDLVSFQEYVDEMKPNQKDIYFLGGETKEAILNSPLLERLVKKGYDVLLMVDPIDEYLVSAYTKFDKFKLKNLGKEELKLKEDEDEMKQMKDEFKPLLEYLKTVLPDVQQIVLSSRLTRTPAALVSSSFGISANQERILRAQALADEKTRQMFNAKFGRIFEVNPFHPLVKQLNDMVKEEKRTEAKDLADLLYDTALLHSGYSVPEPRQFAEKVYKMMSVSLGLDLDEIEKVQETLEKQAEEEGATEETTEPEPETEQEKLERLADEFSQKAQREAEDKDEL